MAQRNGRKGPVPGLCGVLQIRVCRLRAGGVPDLYGSCWISCPAIPRVRRIFPSWNPRSGAIGVWFRWVYFRRKSADGEFKLFSDQKSRCQYLSRVIQFVGAISALNLVVGICNTVLAAILLEPIYYWAWINLLLGLWGSYGTARLLRKRSKMKREAQLFE